MVGSKSRSLCSCETLAHLLGILKVDGIFHTHSRGRLPHSESGCHSKLASRYYDSLTSFFLKTLISNCTTTKPAMVSRRHDRVVHASKIIDVSLGFNLIVNKA